jgi:hypothetical protein
MALALFDRVQETSTTAGTGSIILAGAVSGFQSFAVVGNGNTCYYTIVDGSAWEVGVGTYSTSGPTLARTTILSNSNGNTSPLTLTANSKSVFLTYPASKSVNLNESGNVSPLGTVVSGIWNGTTIGVAYGGTGVTASSGANSVVLRDSNQNITVNRINQGIQTITASGGTTVLTAASQFNQALVGTGGHTFRLPDATTLTDTTTFQFNNNATGTLTIQNNAGTTVGSIASGGAAGIALLSNATVGGTWDVHAYIPENVTWGTNALTLGSTVISGGTWQGGTIATGYGGTGLTSYTSGGAVYANSSSTLTSGTLPLTAGGTAATTAAGARTSLDVPSTTGTGATGTWNINITGSAGSSPGYLPLSGGTMTGNILVSSTSVGAQFGNLSVGYGGAYNTLQTKDGSSELYLQASSTGNINIGPGGGYTTIYQSTRSPIFYDSDNTTYYVDPNGTSQLSLGRFQIPAYGGGSGVYSDSRMTLSVGGSGLGSIVYQSQYNDANYPDYGMVFIHGASGGNRNVWSISPDGPARGNSLSFLYDLNSTNIHVGTTRFRLDGSGNTFSQSSSRAPIFYDSDNTGYYGDFAGTSNIYNLTINGVIGDGTAPLRLTPTSSSGSFQWASTAISSGLGGGQTMLHILGNALSTGNSGYLGYRYVSAANGGNFVSLGFYGNDNLLRVYNSVYTEASGSMRSPIFYDLDNTGYYVDPASTSNLVGLTVANTISGSISGNSASVAGLVPAQFYNNMGNNHSTYTDFNSVPGFGNYYVQGSTNGPTGIAGNQFYGFTLGLGNEYSYSLYASQIYYPRRAQNSDTYIYVRDREGGSWTSWVKIRAGYADSAGSADYNGLSNKGGGTGTYTTSGDYRAPIFYDSSNTTYYIDPNGMSSMYGVAIRGDQSSTDSSNQIFFWGAGNTTTSAIGFKANGGQFPNPTGFGDGYNTYLTMDSDGRGWVFRRGVGGSDFNSAYTAGWILNNGVWQANASMRAPIFYDSNDTGYYADPNSTGTSFRGRGQMFIGPNSSGRYTRFGGDGGATDEATVSASNGNLHIDCKSGYAMYLNYYTNNNVYSYGNLGLGSASADYRLHVHGTGYATSDFRTPIFYDSNNTGYYLNMDGTSNFATTVTGYMYFLSNRNTSTDSPPLQAYSNNNGGAIMAFHRGGQYAINMGLDSDNVFRIGGWSAGVNRLQMDMSGNLTMAGNVTAYSDERLKKDWADLPSNFIESLAQLKIGTYTRIDSEERQVGASAQGLQKFLKEAVQTDADGMLSVNYGGAALASAVELAKYVTALEQRIAQLEARF